MSEERVKVWSTPPIATGGRAVNSAVAELAEFPRWVVWKAEQRNGKPSKVPYQVGGRRRASSTDPKTWSDFDSCWKSAFVDGDATGIGIVVTDGPDHLMAADIDHCIARDGTIEPWAMDVVRRLNSYTEISPSGTGLRVFFLGTMPDEGRKVRYQGGHLELYRTKRYLTVTGAHLSGTPSGIIAVEPCIIADLLGAPTKTDGKTNGEAQTETIDAIGEILDELRDRLNDAIADGPALSAAYNGEPPLGADQTRSAFDLKLAGALKRNGGFTLSDFATIAKWWPYGKGKAGDLRHWRRTWDAAGQQQAKPNGKACRTIGASAAQQQNNTATQQNKASVQAVAAIGLSEHELALEFTRRHRAGFRYVACWGRWMKWTGCRWRHESTQEVFDLPRKVCWDAGKGLNKPKLRARVLSASTCAAVENLARSDRAHAAVPEQWDRDLFALNEPRSTP